MPSFCGVRRDAAQAADAWRGGSPGASGSPGVPMVAADERTASGTAQSLPPCQLRATAGAAEDQRRREASTSPVLKLDAEHQLDLARVTGPGDLAKVAGVVRQAGGEQEAP